MAGPWRRFIQWFELRTPELRQGIRATIAGVLAYSIAQGFNLPQGYWAAFTAVLVMQGSVGGSVKAAIDWLIGTLGGAAYGALVATLIPHESIAATAAALAVALLPMAPLAALRPSFRVAPLSAMIVVVSANSQALTPLLAAVDRVLEIFVGGVIGVVVALVVLPARAHNLVAEATAQTLTLFAQLFAVLAATFAQQPTSDDAEIQQLHLRILGALGRLDAVVEEARRERVSYLTTAPDAAPLPRTLHRLRADLIVIGRAAPAFFPEVIRQRLAPPLSAVAAAVAAYLQDTSVALLARRPPPPVTAAEEALARFAAALAALRSDQLTRDLTTDIVGRVFALGFALEQLQLNLRDFANRVSERAREK